MAFVDVLVNVTVVPDTTYVKFAVGFGFINTCLVTITGPPEPFTVSFTLNVPAVDQVTVGFCCVEVSGTPFWKVQTYPVIAPVDWLLKETGWLMQAGLGDQSKSATSGVVLHEVRQPLLIFDCM